MRRGNPGCTFLTFAFGLGAWYSSNKVNEKQAVQLRQFDKDLTAAKTKLGEQEVLAADAQKNLAGLQKDAADAKAAQQRVETDLAKAKERAAGLEIEALTLRKELLRQGPRANLITGDSRIKLVNALKPFAGQRVDVRHSASVMMVNSRIVQVTPIGDDVVDLANTLIAVFKESGWKTPDVMPSNRRGHGVVLSISPKASAETRAAAEALLSALKDVLPTGVQGSLGPDNLMKRPSEDPVQPLFDSDSIVVDVLGHP